ncbi:hypothetical protein ABW20_dc0100661 [Dactylellina cionopaga]|nr:hypothetical protein ABW20_dc0100661 [Dactylellina cionopaga]
MPSKRYIKTAVILAHKDFIMEKLISGETHQDILSALKVEHDLVIDPGDILIMSPDKIANAIALSQNAEISSPERFEVDAMEFDTAGEINTGLVMREKEARFETPHQDEPAGFSARSPNLDPLSDDPGNGDNQHPINWQNEPTETIPELQSIIIQGLGNLEINDEADIFNPDMTLNNPAPEQNRGMKQAEDDGSFESSQAGSSNTTIAQLVKEHNEENEETSEATVAAVKSSRTPLDIYASKYQEEFELYIQAWEREAKDMAQKIKQESETRGIPLEEAEKLISDESQRMGCHTLALDCFRITKSLDIEVDSYVERWGDAREKILKVLKPGDFRAIFVNSDLAAWKLRSKNEDIKREGAQNAHHIIRSVSEADFNPDWALWEKKWAYRAYNERGFWRKKVWKENVPEGKAQ